MLALIACFLGEMGGRSQHLSMILGQRYRQTGLIVCGLVIAASANAAISAYAGSLVAHVMGGDARNLFMALAFLCGGAVMWFPVKAPDPLASWRIGPLATSALGLFILGFGEGAQFLIAGIAIARGDMVLSAIGGAIGVTAACLPAMLGGPEFFAKLRAKFIRKTGAILFLGIGAGVAVHALGLV